MGNGVFKNYVTHLIRGSNLISVTQSCFLTLGKLFEAFGCEGLCGEPVRGPVEMTVINHKRCSLVFTIYFQVRGTSRIF